MRDIVLIYAGSLCGHALTTVATPEEAGRVFVLGPEPLDMIVIDEVGDTRDIVEVLNRLPKVPELSRMPEIDDYPACIEDPDQHERIAAKKERMHHDARPYHHSLRIRGHGGISAVRFRNSQISQKRRKGR